MKQRSPKQSETRREALQKIAYVAPIVATMAVSPAFAQNGSVRRPGRGRLRPRAAADVPSSARNV